MGKYRLVVASVVLLALLGLVIWKLGEDDTPATMEQPDLADALPDVTADEVDRLEVEPSGKSRVVLAKADGTWRLVEPLDAEADADAVTRAVEKLAGLEVTSVAATREQNHERLHVGEKKGILVTVKKGDHTLAELVVGRYRSGNTMVRLKGGEKVYAVDGSIRHLFDKEVDDWREHEIVAVSSDDASEVRVETQERTFHFVRKDDTWQQAEGQKPIEDFDSAKVKSLVSSLTALRASGFAEPMIDPAKAGLDEEPVSVVTLTLSPGEDAGTPQQIRLRVGALADESSGKRYVVREGREPIYIVSKHLSERLVPDVDYFATTEEERKAEEAAAAARKAAPHGAMGRPGGPPGGQKLPPGMMKKLQKQLQQRGMQQ